MKNWRKSDIAKMIFLVPTTIAVGALLVSNIRDNYLPKRQTSQRVGLHAIQERPSKPISIESVLSDPLGTPTDKDLIKLEPPIHHPVFWMRNGKAITSETSNATETYSNETSSASYLIQGGNIVTRVNYISEKE